MPKVLGIGVQVSAFGCAGLSHLRLPALVQPRASLEQLAGPVWLELLLLAETYRGMWRLLEQLYAPGGGALARGVLEARGAPHVSLAELQAQLPSVVAQVAHLLPLRHLTMAIGCLLQAHKSGSVRPAAPPAGRRGVWSSLRSRPARSACEVWGGAGVCAVDA